MRAFALALLWSSAAFAQVVRPLGETPGDLGPSYKTFQDTATAPERAGRFSAFSAGQGGPLFAFSQIVDGMLVGGLIGFGVSGSATPYSMPLGIYVGGLSGGLVLGSLGVLLQYFQRIGLVGAGAATLGLGVGALFGLGVAELMRSSIEGLPVVLPGVLALVGSQVGAFVPLALSWASDDLAPSALALMASLALHGVALTGLVTLAAGARLSGPAMLLAPAAGMAVGGVLAAFLRVDASTVLLHAVPALLAGLAAFFASAAVFDTLQGPAFIALGSMAVSVGVTSIVSASRGPAQPLEVTPTLAVVPPVAQAPAAAFPALVGRF